MPSPGTPYLTACRTPSCLVRRRPPAPRTPVAGSSRPRARSWRRGAARCGCRTSRPVPRCHDKGSTGTSRTGRASWSRSSTLTHDRAAGVNVPSSAVTVCEALSSFVHVTVSPTATLSVAGLNANPVIARAQPPAGDGVHRLPERRFLISSSASLRSSSLSSCPEASSRSRATGLHRSDHRRGDGRPDAVHAPAVGVPPHRVAAQQGSHQPV